VETTKDTLNPPVDSPDNVVNAKDDIKEPLLNHKHKFYDEPNCVNNEENGPEDNQGNIVSD